MEHGREKLAKKRRKRRKHTPPRIHPKAAPPSSAPAQGRTPRQSAPKVAAAPSIDLSLQYAYVVEDLKRIALLAGILFAVLIALSFVLG